MSIQCFNCRGCYEWIRKNSTGKWNFAQRCCCFGGTSCFCDECRTWLVYVLLVSLQSNIDETINCFYFIYPRSGIYDDPACVPGVGHSALIYGYGTARYAGGRTVDYWLCKNSWSDQWGKGGHFKMVRGKNMCGLTSYLIYPTIWVLWWIIYLVRFISTLLSHCEALKCQ